MASTRIIDCIGASSTDIVRLSLLLQHAAGRLDDIWHWGPEEEAEVVLVDPSNATGQAALQRTRGRGVPFAQLIAADAPAPDTLYLRRPVGLEELIALLNEGMKSTVAPFRLIERGEGFFDIDFELDPPDDAPPPDLGIALPSTASDGALDDFESLFRRDPLADTPHFLVPGRLGAGTGVEFIDQATSRSAARADIAGNPFLQGGLSDLSVDPTFRHGVSAKANANRSFPLRDYLEGNLLGGPARIKLWDAPLLVLDPKERLFHAEGRLPALESYCKHPLRLGDWERLVNLDLQEIRQRVPARPYQRLAWMDRYLNSNGYLAPHLDPGGTYKLTRWLELAQDYAHAFRIGRNMMTPQRLGDIARASELPLAEVFDVVNAYEAIGFLEWTHRARAPRADG